MIVMSMAKLKTLKKAVEILDGLDEDRYEALADEGCLPDTAKLYLRDIIVASEVIERRGEG